MTTQTTNNDTLLSLWALEQDFYRTGVEGEPLMCLFSGGQDSSTLAWLLYHTDAYRLSIQNLAHCTHLLQPDNIFMAQHAVDLSFWLGWRHTSIFPAQALMSENEASCWRALIRRRVATHTAAQVSVNGHTETDNREAAFFKFMRVFENSRMPSIDTQSGNGFSRCNTSTLSYAGAYFRSVWSDDTRFLKRTVREPQPSSPADAVMPVIVRRPLMLLNRSDTRLLVTSQRLPVYPDQTNFECRATRAQVRYLVFPLLARLGFTFFE